MEKLLCPSMMCADYGRLADEIKALDEAGVDIFHCDIMDGTFVPNITMGLMDLKTIRKYTKKPVDVHLMIENPGEKVDWFLDAGADIVYIHPESERYVVKTLAHIKSRGAAAGIAINPDTSLATVEEMLNLCDYVMVMTVNPGFAGQKFIQFTKNKVRALAELKEKYGFKLMIDGYSELMFAFGSDMVLLNTIDLDNWDNNPGLQGLTYQELKARCGQRPIGVYLGCPKAGSEDGGKKALYRREGMLCTPEHVQKCVDMGVDFVILGGNPGSGTSITDVVACTRWVKETYGDKLFVFAGKWEDGINEKVLGDPLAQYDAKDIIRQLIDAGADCIDLPAPGSRSGISVHMIQELVQYVHRYKPGTLAMTFLNSSVEGADPDTVRLIALKMKETGADVHAIGDGGFAGCTSPENIHQLSVSIKGRPYTYFRMASTNI